MDAIYYWIISFRLKLYNIIYISKLIEFTKWMIMSRYHGTDMISRPWDPGCIPVAYCRQYGVGRIRSKLIKFTPAADLKHCVLQRRVVAQKDAITNQWDSTVS